MNLATHYPERTINVITYCYIIEVTGMLRFVSISFNLYKGIDKLLVIKHDTFTVSAKWLNGLFVLGVGCLFVCFVGEIN